MDRPNVVSDPQRVHLRKGLRAAVVVPLVLVGASMISDGAGLFAAFAAFAALVFADFMGDRTRVARAYLALAACGTVGVVVGSAVSAHLAVAAAVLFAYAFLVRFAGCFGGYVVAASAPLLLGFALSVMTPPSTVASGRVAGWLIGSAAALAAALIAPVPQSHLIRDGVAARCRELSVRLRTVAGGARPAPVEMTRVLELREELAASASRPVSPSAGAAALTDLLDAVGRASLLVADLQPPGTLAAAEGRALSEAAADTFDGVAAVLDGDGPVDARPVAATMDAHRAVLIDTIGRAEGTERGAVCAEVTATAPLRIMSALAVMAAAAAGQVAHEEVEVPDGFGAATHDPGARAFVRRALATARFHLDPRAPRFRNSVRAAGALTLSLVVARAGGFDHGFWVVLGTLLVLRGSAADTEVSARQALIGTTAGFVVAAPLIIVVDGNVDVLWVLLPLVTFAAAWAPGAIGMGTGQASFTVFVVVLFNVISPEGYITAVARVEDVAIGAAVAVVAGFVFWPRGSEAVLAPAVARHYRAARDALGVLAAERLGTPLSSATRLHSRNALLATRAGLNETFADLAADLRVNVELAERTAVFTPPSLVELAVATFGRFADDPRPQHGSSRARTQLESRVFEVETGFDAIADTLTSRSDLQWRPARDPDDPTVLDPPDGDATQVLELLWLGVWLDTIERALGAAARPTIEASTAMPRRWWR